MQVGVLAVQGDFAEHERALALCGVASREVRRPGDFANLQGLVLPGGESTTMLRLLASEGLEAPLLATIASGIPVLATCAGMILLARAVTQPVQRSFSVLDIAVARNGYGRQIASGTFALGSERWPGLQGVFIRAPRILSVGPAVEVLARRGPDPVVVAERNVLAACFHPELEARHPLTLHFVDCVRKHAMNLQCQP